MWPYSSHSVDQFNEYAWDMGRAKEERDKYMARKKDFMK